MLKKLGLLTLLGLASQSALAATLDLDCMKKAIDEETAAIDLLTEGMSSNSRIMDILSGSLGRFAGEVRNNSRGGETCIDSQISAATLTELSVHISRVRRDNSSLFFGMLASSTNLKSALKNCQRN